MKQAIKTLKLKKFKATPLLTSVRRLPV